MKKIYTLCLLFIISYGSNAQVTFQKTYGGSDAEGLCYVTNTSDGGYAVAGVTQSFGAGSTDIYLVRVDDVGNILWTKTYGGSQPEVAYNMQQTTDGGFIITGYTRSFGAGEADVYLVKTDMNGDTLWTKTYGQAGTDELGWAVQETTDGGYIIAAQWPGSYGYLIRTNSTGNVLWTNINDLGIPFSITPTARKGFIVCDGVNGNMGLYQIDSLGTIVWSKGYGGPGNDVGLQAINANDGGFIAIGYTKSFGTSLASIYVVKTDSTGQVMWSNTYDEGRYSEGDGIVSTGNGYTLLGRYTLNNLNFSAELINIDNSGNINWARDYYLTLGSVGSVRKTSDGFVFSAFSEDEYLIKTDNQGNSGCSDSANHSINVITSATHTDTINYNLQSGSTAVGATQTSIGSGGTATTLCLSTGIENIAAVQNKLLIYPNPCADCQLKGVDNTNDLVVTDILGRNVPVIFTKASGGYEMHFAELPNGIYIVRNIKTGEVQKIIRL